MDTLRAASIFVAASLLTGAPAWADRDEHEHEHEHEGHGSCAWTQWGQSAAHDGQTCVSGQSPRTELFHFVYDPFQTQEIEEGGGDLFVHYQVPLSDEDGNVFIMHKEGTYTSCDPPGSGDPFPCGIDPGNRDGQIWAEKGFRWHGDRLVEKWTFQSDWKPFPIILWEPMFQPATWGAFIYVPGVGGSVWQLDKRTGHAIQRLNPFATLDPDTYVTGGVTVDRFGFLYWNAVHQDPVSGFDTGYLVKGAMWGRTKAVTYDSLIPDAPTGRTCYQTFANAQPRPPRPWPPSASALPPLGICGAQRPGANITPAIGPDGTIFTASRAQFNGRYSYVLALRPDLSVRWHTSMRGLVNDGCGVDRGPDFPEGNVVCSATYSAVGVEPTTNLPPALTVDDQSSATPVALPDGGVVLGTLDGYNFSRGHLLKLDRHGRFAASHSFGWDTTPAVYQHHGTYSLVMKDNHYVSGGPFLLIQLDRDLVPEWQFQNTTTQACTRLPDGTLSCSDTTPDGEEHPNGFEWCVNAPAVDKHGNVYANAEDGFVYQIGQGGVLKTQTFLNQALGAAYTPIAIDPRGRIYALNNGELGVFGH